VVRLFGWLLICFGVVVSVIALNIWYTSSDYFLNEKGLLFYWCLLGALPLIAGTLFPKR